MDLRDFASRRRLGLLIALVLLLGAARLARSTRPPRCGPAAVEPGRAPWYRFALLPGCGTRVARRIPQHRARIDALAEPGRLLGVSGVGSARLHRWSPSLRDPSPCPTTRSPRPRTP